MKIMKKTSVRNTTVACRRKIKYIVVHYSAGVTSKAGSAANLAGWYATDANNVSSDYTVDDASLVQYNPDIPNRYTWHCGGSKYATKGGALYGKCTNANSIGIEVCSNNATGKMTYPNDPNYTFTAAEITNLVGLVKYLMNKYSIDADHVVRHYDVTGKVCPGVIGWNNEDGWNDAKWRAFKKRLQPASNKVYKVQVGAFKTKEAAQNYAGIVQNAGFSAIIVEDNK